jgi:hypothetical protein
MYGLDRRIHIVDVDTSRRLGSQEVTPHVN